MKNNYFFIKLLSVLLFNTSAIFAGAPECTPDESVTEAVSYGVEGMQAAKVNVYYEQVIYFKVPQDTAFESDVFGTVDADVNYLKIDEVVNMPNGLSYTCTPANCQFPGGGYGCMIIYGTPTQEGEQEVTLKMTIDATGIVFNSPVNHSFPYDEVFTITIQPEDDLVSAPKVYAENKIQVYPNPTSDLAQLNIKSTEKGNLEIAVFNLLGNRVHYKQVNNFIGTYNYNLNQAKLGGKGLFFVVTKINGKEEVTKLIIQ